MLIFNEERFADVYEEMKPLLDEHWKELANNQEERPLDVDVETYTRINDLGFLRLFTVREDGKLIGYAAFTVTDNSHYKGWLTAVADVYYIEPSHRKKGTGQKFFEYLFRAFKSTDIKLVVVQEKIRHSHKEFFESLGLTHTENLYEKIL